MMEWNLLQVVIEIFAVASPNQELRSITSPRAARTALRRAGGWIKIKPMVVLTVINLCSATLLDAFSVVVPVHQPFVSNQHGGGCPTAALSD